MRSRRLFNLVNLQGRQGKKETRSDRSRNPSSWDGARPSDQDTFPVSHRIMTIRSIWNRTVVVHGRWRVRASGRVRVKENNSPDGVEP